MTRTYTILGMTCNGCKASVERLLNEIPEVIKATVHLENKEARIVIEKQLPIKILQKALPKKYTIIAKEGDSISSLGKKENMAKKNEWQQLKPLLLIFGYMVIAAILLNYNPWELHGFMLDFMGLFYIVFSFFKLLDLRGFPPSFSMYDPLAKAFPLYGWIYPFIEILLGMMFLIRIEIRIALIATIIALGITTIGVTKILLDKKSIQCACLGTLLKLPMTKATFIENSIMLAMAVGMLYHLYF